MKRNRKISPLRLSAMSLALLPLFATAAPTGGHVVAGNAQITRPSSTQTFVRQNSGRAVINWDSFSIGSGESVVFRQPGKTSVALNRVTGNEASEIFGSLQSNGQVFLINRNGVLFAPGAQVNVGALVASTLDIADEDFMRGRYRFSGSSDAAVINQGSITAATRGTVALLGATVRNDGSISAKLGTVVLGAGQRMELDLAGDGLTKLRIDEQTLAALVENGGLIRTAGGQVLLQANAVNQLAAAVINQNGIVQATSLVERNGRILLDSGDEGLTEVRGTLDVSGVRGGKIQVLGKQVGLLDQASLDASGDKRGGTVLIGGDYKGGNAQVRNAEATYVAPDVLINADATTKGNGGKVIVWSDEATRMYGTISATGGARGGNGGFIETSGGFLDVAGARVNASAPKGRGGEWLLDPHNITILPGGGTTNVTGGPNYLSTGDSAVVGADLIEAALEGGSNVTITTSGVGGTEPGDITIAADIIVGAGFQRTLTFNAEQNIFMNDQFISAAPGVRLDVRFNAGLGGSGSILLEQAGVATGGGNVHFNAGAATGGRGGVFLQDSSVVTTDGAAFAGSVYFYGGSNQGQRLVADGSAGMNIGVHLLESTIDVTNLAGGATGEIDIHAQGADNVLNAHGILIDQSQLISLGITLDGTGGAGSGTGSGVRIQGLSSFNSLGGILIDGVASGAQEGVRITDTTIDAINFIANGTGAAAQGSGIGIAQTIINANIELRGTGTGGYGVGVVDSTFNAGTLGIDITGIDNAGGAGVHLIDSLLDANGAISVRGAGSSDPSSVLSAYGVHINNSGLFSAVGEITVLGRGGVTSAGDFAGVRLIDSIIQGSGGDIAVAGYAEGAAAGLHISGASTIFSDDDNADIALFAGNGSTTDSIILGGSILGGDFLSLTPGRVNVVAGVPTLVNVTSTAINLLDAAQQNFSLSASDWGAIGSFQHLVIGSMQQAGAITVHNALNYNGNLTLDSDNIVINGTIDIDDNALTLRGSAAQGPGAFILAESLILLTGNVVLNNVGNAVQNISMLGDAMEFTTLSDVTVTSNQAGLYDFFSGTMLTNVNDSDAGEGNYFLRSMFGNIILQNNISADGAVTLVAGNVLDNTAARTLTSSGAPWRVFASTWVGEVRGGLAGSGPRPNLYNCTFGVCTPAPSTGNQFIYAGQPTVTVTANNRTMNQGGPIPTFTATATGLINGDVAGNALNFAGMSTPATGASPPGVYAINGPVTSPAGYLVNFVGGSLTILPFVGPPTGPSTPPTVTPPTIPGAWVPLQPIIASLNPLLGSSSDLYGTDMGIPHFCGAKLSSFELSGQKGNDALALEWSRVKESPNMDRCNAIAQGKGCTSF